MNPRHWIQEQKQPVIKNYELDGYRLIQCPLDIATLDIVAALPIATSTPVTNLRQYINSDLGYNDLKIQPLCSKIATVNPF